jgi:peptidoglycan/xylan/chitin deacetylase (PgdA/CDA1 family)
MAHLACLTFDFDAISPWLFRGQNTPTAISRGEFGVVGAARILELLERFQIKSTWFIPGHTIDTYPDACKLVVAAGHEIAHHGYLHEPPALVDREQEEAILVRGIECIEHLTGAPPVGYRSPSWDLSPHTVELLLAHGFLYDSSMMAHDHLPYPARQGDVMEKDRVVFGPPTRLLEMPVSWSLDDFPHFEYRRFPDGSLQEGLKNAGAVMENFVDDFRFMAQTDEHGVLTYTFHPQVVGRGHRMLMLERLIEELIDLGAEFTRMDEAAGQFLHVLPAG